LLPGTVVTGTTAGATGVIGAMVGVTTNAGAIIAGGAIVAGAIRVALEGTDKFAKSAGDNLLRVAR
jgi:hypothetical protein